MNSLRHLTLLGGVLLGCILGPTLAQAQDKEDESTDSQAKTAEADKGTKTKGKNQKVPDKTAETKGKQSSDGTGEVKSKKQDDVGADTPKSGGTTSKGEPVSPPQNAADDAPQSVEKSGETSTNDPPASDKASPSTEGAGSDTSDKATSAAGETTSVDQTDEAAKLLDDADKVAEETRRITTLTPVEKAMADAKQRALDEKLPPEIAELSIEVAGFEAQVQEYQKDVDRIVDLHQARREAQIERRNAAYLRELSLLESKRRADAIKELELFIAKYPKSPQFSPTALVRLAELYFEDSKERYDDAKDQFDGAEEEHRKLELAFEDGRSNTKPSAFTMVEPEVDYTRTIDVANRLVKDWPNFSDLDLVYYLLGYCHSEMDEESVAAKDAFQQLVQRFPTSGFAAEAWIRLGEYHYETNQLKKAIFAYQKATEFKDDSVYDLALYKLAWAYYRDNQYERAVNGFHALIKLSDKKTAETGATDENLRSDAIEFFSYCLHEEDWDGDGEPDPNSGFARVTRYISGDQPFEVDVLAMTAELFFDAAQYEDSIATTRYLLEKFPSHPKNPTLHAKIVEAYERSQEKEAASSERDRLTTAYGPSSTWYRDNRDNPEALAAAEALAQEMLYDRALYHHSRAQDFRRKGEEGDQNAERVALLEYEKAADSYELYLARFPTGKNAYDLSFNYAECLYWSEQYPRAARQYEQVRDSKSGKKHAEESAFYAISAHRETVKKLVKQGKVAARPSLVDEPLPEVVEAPPSEDEEGDGRVKKIEAEPIPDEVNAMIAARTTYYDRGFINTEEKSRRPENIFEIGTLFLDFDDYESARKWFGILITKYPREKVTAYAAESLMETFRRENDVKNMEVWAEKIASAGLGRDFDEKIRTMKVSALFRSAETLFKNGQYKKAAEEYIRLVEENPKNRYADRALYNAAVAYEKTRRFESATKTYERIYTEHPDSPFVEDAMYQVGLNSDRFYDYDKAIETYLMLVSKFPNSVNRADALFRAAMRQEHQRKYLKAALNYERYAKLFPSRNDTGQTYFQAGEIYKKLDDPDNESRIYSRFVSEYGGDPAQNVRVLEGLTRVAEIQQAKGQKKAARRTWRRIIDEFNRRDMKPATYEAQFPARALFELIEKDFAVYNKIELSGSVAVQRKKIKDAQRRLADLYRRYSEIGEYQSMEWSIAALYRSAYLFQRLGKIIIAAPAPNFQTEEQEEMYYDMVEAYGVQFDDRAKADYKFAIEKARQFKIVNRWTKKILSALNSYDPSTYPLFKEEKRITAGQQLTTPRMINLRIDLAAAGDAEESTETNEAPTPESESQTSEEAAPGASSQGEPAGSQSDALPDPMSSGPNEEAVEQ